MVTRRNFMHQAGLIALAMLARPNILCSTPASRKKVGLQLYTLREEIAKDVKGVIAKVAGAGYQEMELFGFSRRDNFWGIEPRAFREILDSNHLTAPSGHYSIDEYLSPAGKEDDLRAFIEVGKVLGHTYITVPFLNENIRKTADDYKRIAEKFNKAAAICKSEGMHLAYHNHDFEFARLGDVMGYDILLKETDPSLVKFELDIYWAVRGGQDPVTLFKAHPGRFALWHVKDMDKQQMNLNTEIGKGSIDYKKIFASSKIAGAEHFIVEQENFSIDPFVSIRSSCDYIRKELQPLVK